MNPVVFVYLGKPVLVIEKTGGAIVASLHDVQRQTVDVNACTPGHTQRLAEI